MIPLHSMSRPFYDQPLPEFKPAEVRSGETPLHRGWLPVLARVPLFSALSQRQLRHVADLAELRRFKRGAEIVREGSVGNAFYVIMDGRAEVATQAGHTRTLEAGEFFGELALLDGAPRAATVTATEALAAARIARTPFLRLLKEQPELGVGLAQGMVVMIRDMQRDD
jgi:CRP-like cAMP-binding protein